VKVQIEDIFVGIVRAQYEVLYFDEAFNDALGRALRMGRRLLHLERTQSRIVRRVCFEPDQAPDAPVKQAFGTSRASFVEEIDYDPSVGRGAWRTIPNLFADRVTNAGTIEFADAGGDTRRTVRGEVAVRLFGFGKVVEKMIVAEIVKSYTATTAFTRDWLAGRRG
jgi:hypothetical protein